MLDIILSVYTIAILATSAWMVYSFFTRERRAQRKFDEQMENSHLELSCLTGICPGLKCPTHGYIIEVWK